MEDSRESELACLEEKPDIPPDGRPPLPAAPASGRDLTSGVRPEQPLLLLLGRGEEENSSSSSSGRMRSRRLLTWVVSEAGEWGVLSLFAPGALRPAAGLVRA